MENFCGSCERASQEDGLIGICLLHDKYVKRMGKACRDYLDIYRVNLFGEMRCTEMRKAGILVEASAWGFRPSVDHRLDKYDTRRLRNTTSDLFPVKDGHLIYQEA